jgi:predicted dehydrogenase
MTTQARIGVIGAGWWATDTHIPALRQHPHAELIAICDANPERLQAAAAKYEIGRAYTDYGELLAQEALDGVVIVTSNATHYVAAKAALEHDLHVMLEKPMTLFAREARELAELAAERGRQLIVGYPFNYTTYARRARQVIQSGELGAVQFINLIYNSYMTPLFKTNHFGNYQFAVHAPDQYTRPDQTGGGHGQVQVTHAAGLLFHVSGLRPRQVGARMANHGLAVDLVDAMTVEFEGGALGTVGGSGNLRGMTFLLQVACEEGWIDIDARAGTATIHRTEKEVEVVSDEKRDLPTSYLTAHNLVDIITSAAENGSTAEVGWRAVELLDAAYRSAARQGQPIEIEQLYLAKLGSGE